MIRRTVSDAVWAMAIERAALECVKSVIRHPSYLGVMLLRMMARDNPPPGWLPTRIEAIAAWAEGEVHRMEEWRSCIRN